MCFSYTAFTSPLVGDLGYISLPFLKTCATGVWISTEVVVRNAQETWAHILFPTGDFAGAH